MELIVKVNVKCYKIFLKKIGISVIKDTNETKYYYYINI